MNRDDDREERQKTDSRMKLDPDEVWNAELLAFLTKQRPEVYAPLSATAYKSEFHKWVNEVLRPDAFVTINLPHERHSRRLPRDAQFYLNLWTRHAEAKLLGRGTLNDGRLERRMLWLFRREVAADGLIHYHGLVKFPIGRPWKDETTTGTDDLADRCLRLQNALQRASARTPEPFTMKFPTPAKPALQHPISSIPRLVKKDEPPRQPKPLKMSNPQPWESADIDVRLYDDAYHAPYLLKGLWSFVPDGVTDESTWDSGLLILPHRPKHGKRTRRRERQG
jgi:hypothetical protein